MPHYNSVGLGGAQVIVMLFETLGHTSNNKDLIHPNSDIPSHHISTYYILHLTSTKLS